MKRFLGAYCCIIRDGKVLLLRREKPPIWEFPGGKIEEDESPREAAVRETKEEADLDVEIEVRPLITSHILPDAKDAHIFRLGEKEHVFREGSRFIAFIFLAKSFRGDVKLTEHLAWRWFTKRGLKGLPLSPNVVAVYPDIRGRLR